jgi:hypothetical protein
LFHIFLLYFALFMREMSCTSSPYTIYYIFSLFHIIYCENPFI